MKVIVPLIAVGVIGLVGAAGAYLPPALFGVVIPYAALVIFIGGVCWKVFGWARSPVPFRIPTTAGQAKSLPWIKQDKFENPSNNLWVMVRMALEIFAFRSLFRNTKAELKQDNNLSYGQDVFLWLGAIAFHYAFLIVVLRHFRFFMEPTPFWVGWIEAFDGFMEVSVPTVMMTGLLLLGAAAYLFFRRIYYPQVRYISLVQDYFPLFLIIAIALTGIAMKHFGFFRADLLSVKELMVGIFMFKPVLPQNVAPMFFAHLFLVCTLIAYFPFSKLMHAPGVFMSPTRNMASNNREKRHINPWNPDVRVHTYMEYEDEFRDVMKDAGMPLEKES